MIESNDTAWMEKVVETLDAIFKQRPDWDIQSLREIFNQDVYRLLSYENREHRTDYRISMMKKDAIYCFSVVREVSENEKLTADILELKSPVHITDFYFIPSKIDFREDWRLGEKQ